MAKRYRAGIIGVGFIGGADQVSGDALGQRVEDLDGTHLVALDGHPQVDLVAGSSRDQGRRDRFAARTDATAYSDWREMLQKESLDIISVATYAGVHAEMTIGAAEAGARVIFCEKPVATKVVDARRMLAVCQEREALLVFNHQRRFSPNGHRLRDRIANGDLGDLTSVNLSWPTGRLADVGTHVIDAMHMHLGRQIEAVSGTLDFSGKPDCRGPELTDYGAWGTMRMEGGLMVTVDAPDYSRSPFYISINGTEARAVTDGVAVRIDDWAGQIEEFPPHPPNISSMDRAVTGIVEWLDDAKPFPHDPADGINVMEAIAGFHVSHHRNSAWVDLPLDDEGANHFINCA
jgi:predicted dehydrogenase